ncbi:MAG: hypothetical protein CVV56_05710 [Tenericutes bacterium HGW-Tenericutes-1]|jgi:sialate O-acetylesterase|nr:MAG: hypothetical protein CVV56_05710 [Tenericutes bacterium HGW-Tenericutes-1]
MKKMILAFMIILTVLTLIGCTELTTTSTQQTLTSSLTTTTSTSLTTVSTTTSRPLREDETQDIAQDFDLSEVSYSTPISSLSLHSIISDHAVLQQNKPIRVFGKGTPGAIALVKLVMNDNQAISYLNYSIIGSNGEFVVTLPALTASFNDYTLTVSDTLHEIKVHDLLIGEVWLTSGQSNMAMEVREVDDGLSTMSLANNPYIRLFYQYIGDHNGIYPINPSYDVREGQWKVANDGENIAHCSAIAYSYATELFRLLSEENLNVPIAVINSAKGGSNMHSWLSRQAMLETDSIKDYVLNKGLTFSTASYNSYGWNNYNQPQALYSQKIAPLFNYQIKGVVWYQGESDGFYSPTIDSIPLLIDTWSAGFNQNDEILPFVLIQLAPYDGQNPMTSTPNPDYVAYAAHRMAQLDVVKMDKYKTSTVLVPIYDVSLKWDVPLTQFAYADPIHPTTKFPVGERCAKIAYSQFYYGVVDYSAPIIESYTYDATSITIAFSHVARGLKLYKNEESGVTTVSIYLNNGIRQNVNCVIIDDNHIQITGVDTTQIAYFAYGYMTRNDQANLSNSYGVPAIPFKIKLQ